MGSISSEFLNIFVFYYSAHFRRQCLLPHYDVSLCHAVVAQHSVDAEHL